MPSLLPRKRAISKPIWAHLSSEEEFLSNLPEAQKSFFGIPNSLPTEDEDEDENLTEYKQDHVYLFQNGKLIPFSQNTHGKNLTKEELRQKVLSLTNNPSVQLFLQQKFHKQTFLFAGLNRLEASIKDNNSIATIKSRITIITPQQDGSVNIRVVKDITSAKQAPTGQASTTTPIKPKSSIENDCLATIDTTYKITPPKDQNSKVHVKVIKHYEVVRDSAFDKALPSFKPALAVKPTPLPLLQRLLGIGARNSNIYQEAPVVSNSSTKPKSFFNNILSLITGTSTKKENEAAPKNATAEKNESQTFQTLIKGFKNTLFSKKPVTDLPDVQEFYNLLLSMRNLANLSTSNHTQIIPICASFSNLMQKKKINPFKGELMFHLFDLMKINLKNSVNLYKALFSLNQYYKKLRFPEDDADSLGIELIYIKLKDYLTAKFNGKNTLAKMEKQLQQENSIASQTDIATEIQRIRGEEILQVDNTTTMPKIPSTSTAKTTTFFSNQKLPQQTNEKLLLALTEMKNLACLPEPNYIEITKKASMIFNIAKLHNIELNKIFYLVEDLFSTMTSKNSFNDFLALYKALFFLNVYYAALPLKDDADNLTIELLSIKLKALLLKNFDCKKNIDLAEKQVTTEAKPEDLIIQTTEAQQIEEKLNSYS